MQKTRLDQVLVARRLAPDLDTAKRWIMAGWIVVGEHRVDKPGTPIKPDMPIRVKQKRKDYASRAGNKLEAAIQRFAVEVTGKTTLDLGASTGGFTDCLLRFGARKVYAVDVGTNQLDYRLRTDPRVICLEQTHAKKLDEILVPEPIDLFAVDVSFTSLTYVLPHVLSLVGEDGLGICLFKPQFEVTKERVGPGGIVAENDAENAVLAMNQWFAANRLEILGTMKSPLKGREGNQEYLYLIRLRGKGYSHADT